VVLWRAALRIHEALALTEADLDQRRGSLLVRRGKGGRRREVGMDDWGWRELQPWLDLRIDLPVGPLFCVINGATRGRPWATAAARAQLLRTAAAARVRRRFASHQLRHAHAVEMAREGVPLIVIQGQLGHSNLGITSVYLPGIDNAGSSTQSAPDARQWFPWRIATARKTPPPLVAQRSTRLISNEVRSAAAQLELLSDPLDVLRERVENPHAGERRESTTSCRAKGAPNERIWRRRSLRREPPGSRRSASCGCATAGCTGGEGDVEQAAHRPAGWLPSRPPTSSSGRLLTRGRAASGRERDEGLRWRLSRGAAMPDRQLEPWGGEVTMPRFLRRMLRRPESPVDTPEGAHEKRKPQAGPSVLENADKAAAGGVTQIYNEGRVQRDSKRQAKRR
jgi:hypothetical protein